jgi:hypothetical protein
MSERSAVKKRKQNCTARLTFTEPYQRLRFNHWRRLSSLIAQAEMDRHPFKYDTTQPTPGEQQRWIIVEQHAATNSPTTGSN